MTNKFFSPGKIFQYYLPVTLLLFMFVTLERTIKTDASYDKLYGFPLAHVSNSFYSSFHSNVYLGPMFLNILFNFGVSVLLFAGLSKLGLKLKLHWALAILSTLVLVVFALLSYLYISECSFYPSNYDIYTIISRKLVFMY